MSMKFFTLSAVCMLIFCMLLALSGTTDFPGDHPEMVSRFGSVSPPTVPSQQEKGQAMASAYCPPVGSDRQAETESSRVTKGGIARNHHLFLLGGLFIVGWILWSFKLFSKD